jgi:hypothetical protein
VVDEHGANPRFPWALERKYGWICSCRWAIADVSCCCLTVSACQGAPPVQPTSSPISPAQPTPSPISPVQSTPSPSPSVVPGSSEDGSLTDGGERVYFGKMVVVIFVSVSVSLIAGA